MKAIRLKTEYLKDPIGLDIAVPKLFWNCADGMRQTAYQVECQGESGETLWDSGKVQSASMHVRYGGTPLGSRTRVSWKVRLWDENDAAGEWCAPAFFEMGLLHADDWTAKWITGNYTVDQKRRYPVDCFRKYFSVEDAGDISDAGNAGISGPADAARLTDAAGHTGDVGNARYTGGAGKIQKARLYVTACGLYEGCLNGQRIGNFVMAPGHTDYRKRVQYQTYDVTVLLQSGINELIFQLADGWYRGSCGAWGLKNQYGKETKLLAQLELTMSDGSVQTIATDGTWEWSNDGPIRFADNQDGEIVEAWRTPSYAGKAKVTSHTVTPAASNNVPVTEHERLTPVLITTPGGKQVLDFKQNIAGYIEFSLKAEKGQRIFLRFGEMLDETGEFTQKNIQCANKKVTTPLQQVEYFCRKGENHYKTHFAVFGFQYVLVETDVPFRPEDFTAIAVYSDLETTARFEGSNLLLNKLLENTLWSTKNNSLDVPTDCPTRERHGWTGDSQLFAVTAGYLMNYLPFAKKHIRDLTDWQRRDGCFPQIAPEGGVDFYMNSMNGSVGWADAGVLIPYRYWKLFGDEDFIRDNYDAMARYARFMMKRCGKLGLLAKPLGLKGKAKKYAVNAGQSYGEWAEPAEVHPNKWTDMVAPHPEVSTAYTAYVMGVMEEIAEALGKTTDVPLYREYQQGCTAAYQELVETKT